MSITRKCINDIKLIILICLVSISKISSIESPDKQLMKAEETFHMFSLPSGLPMMIKLTQLCVKISRINKNVKTFQKSHCLYLYIWVYPYECVVQCGWNSLCIPAYWSVYICMYVKVQITKNYFPISSWQLQRHCFKEHKGIVSRNIMPKKKRKKKKKERKTEI